MKELSIEDKAKRYNEASKWMEGIYPTLTHEQQMEAEAFFPELKESEDEKIRKEIIRYLKVTSPAMGENIERMLIWLEKQGEMKPAWSEEDESYLNTTIAYLKDAKEFKKTAENCINWLKSLKPKTTWKPSELQMECLYDAIKHYQTNGYPASKLNELYEQMSKIYKL